MTKTIIKRYSTAFKQQIASEYEQGTGISSLKRWVQEYGRQGLRHRMMVIQHPEEQDEVKKLKEKISQLEKAVADLTLDKLMLESTLEVVEKELGELPKKSGVQRSSSKPSSDVDLKDTP